jgi:hypothetical protein
MEDEDFPGRHGHHARVEDGTLVEGIPAYRDYTVKLNPLPGACVIDPKFRN